MPWFKVDDTLPMHTKVLAAGNAAMGLWVRAGAWSMQQLTDGYVPRQIARTLGTSAEARRLVAAGLWFEKDDGYVFHEWAGPDRQRSRAQVEADREEARERQRKAREAARSRRESQEESRRDIQRDSTRDIPRDSSRSHRGSHGPPDQTRPDQPLVGDRSQSSADRNARGPTTTIDEHGLDKIAAACHADRSHADRVAADVLARANGTVRDPLGYVLRAIGDEPGRYRPTPTPPGRCPGCGHYHAAGAPHVAGGTDEPPF